MVTKPPERQAPKPKSSVIRWLLDSDPSIRWQVMRDLTDAPAHEVAAERARVATEGWGARLLALQGADGRWGGAAWNRGWNSTPRLARRPGVWIAVPILRCHPTTGCSGRSAARFTSFPDFKPLLPSSPSPVWACFH
jgi:hypothetical protein